VVKKQQSLSLKLNSPQSRNWSKNPRVKYSEAAKKYPKQVRTHASNMRVECGATPCPGNPERRQPKDVEKRKNKNIHFDFKANKNAESQAETD